MSSAFAVALRGGLEAPGLARRAIAANEPTLPLSVQDDISLLVTELVTNAGPVEPTDHPAPEAPGAPEEPKPAPVPV